MADGVRITPVIPAKAGIHSAPVKKPMDSRLRGNDDIEDPGVIHFRNTQ